jgi:hypothetical protein
LIEDVTGIFVMGWMQLHRVLMQLRRVVMQHIGNVNALQ